MKLILAEHHTHIHNKILIGGNIMKIMNKLCLIFIVGSNTFDILHLIKLHHHRLI